MATKYQRVLPIVHALESKYGSMVNVPKSDSDFKKLRKIYPESSSRDRDFNQIRAKTYSLVQDGYSAYKISKKLHVTRVWVSKYIKDNGLRLKHPFNYLITISGVRYYTESLIYFAKIEFHKSLRSNTDAKIYLQEHGFNIKPGYYVWADIPKGAYFLLNYMDVPKIKKRTNDYIYPPREAIQWKF
ncbi:MULTISPECIES: hypothetical protein [Lactobacillus]|uniref:hypothetical protein n=1 Tax=Lactobacillus TaxID=1578 RepID=UPI000CD97BBF|nr:MULTISPECIES: hypothetical protein [Lactobacillus]RVU73601.1 hypothetical protein EJK20_07305 [Lactobacillus xujianguonis]